MSHAWKRVHPPRQRHFFLLELILYFCLLSGLLALVVQTLQFYRSIWHLQEKQERVLLQANYAYQRIERLLERSCEKASYPLLQKGCFFDFDAEEQVLSWRCQHDACSRFNTDVIACLQCKGDILVLEVWPLEAFQPNAAPRRALQQELLPGIRGLGFSFCGEASKWQEVHQWPHTMASAPATVSLHFYLHIAEGQERQFEWTFPLGLFQPVQASSHV